MKTNELYMPPRDLNYPRIAEDISKWISEKSQGK